MLGNRAAESFVSFIPLFGGPAPCACRAGISHVCLIAATTTASSSREPGRTRPAPQNHASARPQPSRRALQGSDIKARRRLLSAVADSRAGRRIGWPACTHYGLAQVRAARRVRRAPCPGRLATLSDPTARLFAPASLPSSRCFRCPPNTGDKLRSGARVQTWAGAGMRRHVHSGNAPPKASSASSPCSAASFALPRPLSPAVRCDG